MKKISEIASVESKAAFQQRLLEKFVQENLPLRLNKGTNIDGMGQFSLRYKEVECCAAETPVNGTIDLFIETNSPDALRRVSVPAASRFFVFCTRDNTSSYQVTTSTSLS